MEEVAFAVGLTREDLGRQGQGRTVRAKVQRWKRYIRDAFKCQSRPSPVFWWVGRADKVTMGKGVLVVQSVIQKKLRELLQGL